MGNAAVDNFDKSLKGENSKNPQGGKGAVIFNNGSGAGGAPANNGNSSKGLDKREKESFRGDENESAMPSNTGTLMRNLQESERNAEMLSQFRNGINEAMPKYVGAIDNRISEIEEELNALKQERNILMNLTESIKVFN